MDIWHLINCVCKNGDTITHIGDIYGKLWSIDEALTEMLRHNHFYIQSQGSDVELHMIRDKPGGVPVAISSNPDGLVNNNLDICDACL